MPKRCRTLPGVVSGESGTSAPEDFHFQSQSNFLASNSNIEINAPALEEKAQGKSKSEIGILVLNVQCLRAHLAELEFHLKIHQPHIVFLQETWLDLSIEEPSISNYVVVSRRDRSESANRGGVLSLRRSDFNNLAFVENSPDEERSSCKMKS